MKIIKIIDNIVGVIVEFGDLTIDEVVARAKEHIDGYYHRNATIRVDGDTVYIERLESR